MSSTPRRLQPEEPSERRLWIERGLRRIEVYLPPDLVKQLDELRLVPGPFVSRTALIREALEDYLAARGIGPLTYRSDLD